MEAKTTGDLFAVAGARQMEKRVEGGETCRIDEWLRAGEAVHEARLTMMDPSLVGVSHAGTPIPGLGRPRRLLLLALLV